MISPYNVGDSIPLAAQFLDRTGASLTGSATMIVEIFRPADGYFLDWNDGTFKASGWTTKQAALTEVSSSNAPGWYKKTTDWSTSGVAPGSYFVTYRDTSAGAGNSVQQDEVRLADATIALVSGTASAGSATSITLAGASSTDGFYKAQNVAILGGTGAGQVRPILHYVGSTKVATVGPAWTTNPDSTSRYAITTDIHALFVDAGLAQAGGASSITLVSTSSATNDLYVGCEVAILSGTGAGQNRVISAYNGTTKVATLVSAWTTQPDSTSAYVLLPVGRAIAVSVLDKTGYGLAANAVDSTTIADDAITAAKIAAGAITSSEAPALANLDATVSSRLATSGYTTPPTAAAISTQVNTDLTSAHGAGSWATATTVGLNNGAISTATFGAGAIDAAAFAQGAADKVWSTVARTLTAFTGAPLASVVGGVWGEALPGAYGVGTAGKLLASASAPDAATVAAAVWDLATVGHGSAGTFGGLALGIDSGITAIQGAGFTAGVDDLHSIRARGDSAWATPATVVLTDASLTAAKIGAGFVAAMQSGLATSAPLPTSEIIEVGHTEVVPIFFEYARNGIPVIGATVVMTIDRPAGGTFQRYDWDDDTFKAAELCGAPTVALFEVSDSYSPGTYTWLLDIPGQANGVFPNVYFLTIKDGATVLARREIRIRTVDTINEIAGFGAPPSAADISTQVAADLALAHGAGSWATAVGFATAGDVAAAVAAIEAYGQLHWQTAVGFAVAGDAMALTTAERTAVQAKILTDATPFPGARVDAAITSRSTLTAAQVWAHDISSNVTLAQAGGALYGLKILGFNRMEETAGNPGTILVYADDGVTLRFSFTLRDATGGAVTASAGEPAKRGAAT